MNCFNGEKYLYKSISSVIGQSYKNWELIFWDNNSTDNSKKIFDKFNDKRMKYYRSNKYIKLYKARNEAIKKSTGDYITFIDTDDFWVKKKIEKHIYCFQNNLKYSLSYSNWFVLNEKKNTKKIFSKMRLPFGNVTQQLLNNYVINIGTVMMKKKLFKNYKFNEKFEIIGDFDLFIKLSLKYDFYSIQEPLSYYRIHNNNFSNKFKLHALELNNWLKKNKNFFKKKKISLLNQSIYLQKLRLKNFLSL